MKWTKSSIKAEDIIKIAQSLEESYGEAHVEAAPPITSYDDTQKTDVNNAFNDKGNFDYSGMFSTRVKYIGLLNPICKYALYNIVENGEKPIFKTNVGSLEKRAGTCEVKTGVNDTKTVFNNIRAIYKDKIIEAFEEYGEFSVVCYAKKQADAKKYINNLKSMMKSDNQYRGKCLFFSSNDIVFRDDPTVAWGDVIMAEKKKKEIKLNTVDFLTNPKLRKLGLNRRGLILHGPPGTGKTMMIKSLFNTLAGSNVTRVYATSDTFTYPSVVSELFDFLKFTGSTALAFEDMDLISPERENGDGRKVLGALLNNLDGIRKIDDPLVVIGTTNDVGMLDHALANRPCRFDRKIEVPLPEDEQKKMFYNLLVGSDVSEEVIKLSNGFSGAHIKETVNTARLMSAESGTELTECLQTACNVIRENFFPMSKVASSKLYKNKNGKLSKSAQYMILTPLFLDDYHNNNEILQLLDVGPRSSDITDKEATSLWKLWKNQETDIKDNKIAIGEDFGETLVSSLSNKKVLTKNNDGTFSLTDKGKKILRSIILASEKNTFEKDYRDPEFISMLEVKNKIHGSAVKKRQKIAHKKDDNKIGADYYYNAIRGTCED